MIPLIIFHTLFLRIFLNLCPDICGQPLKSGSEHIYNFYVDSNILPIQNALLQSWNSFHTCLKKYTQLVLVLIQKLQVQLFLQLTDIERSNEKGKVELGGEKKSRVEREKVGLDEK